MTDPKEYLIEILEYYVQKLKSNGCTMSEIRSATELLEKNMEVNGTISDFAEFYGKSESNIRSEIARKMTAKPKRKLLYPFHAFAKIVPSKWHSKGSD